MPEEKTRVGFHKDLEEIDQKVVQLFALVAEGVAKATDAFLASDREAAESMADDGTCAENVPSARTGNTGGLWIGTGNGLAHWNAISSRLTASGRRPRARSGWPCRPAPRPPR